MAADKQNGPPREICVTVEINARAVRQTGQGTFAIDLPATILTVEEGSILERLFPNTQLQLDKLHNIESLLASIK